MPKSAVNIMRAKKVMAVKITKFKTLLITDVEQAAVKPIKARNKDVTRTKSAKKTTKVKDVKKDVKNIKPAKQIVNAKALTGLERGLEGAKRDVHSWQKRVLDQEDRLDVKMQELEKAEEDLALVTEQLNRFKDQVAMAKLKANNVNRLVDLKRDCLRAENEQQEKAQKVKRASKEVDIAGTNLRDVQTGLEKAQKEFASFESGTSPVRHNKVSNPESTPSPSRKRTNLVPHVDETPGKASRTVDKPEPPQKDTRTVNKPPLCQNVAGWILGKIAKVMLDLDSFSEGVESQQDNAFGGQRMDSEEE